MPAKERRIQNKVLLIAGIILIAINLRPALAGVGPLIGAIRDSTGLSNTMLGLLTTLPLLAFGVVSMFTSVFTRRFGIEGTIAWALFLLTAGISLRILPSTIALFGGTLLLGIGIAFGNVLLPSLVKRDFPEKTGLMTSLYSSMLGVGAALAAGVSVPIAKDLNLGWHWSLGVWALLSLTALLIWLPQLSRQTLPRYAKTFKDSMSDLGRSKLAWNVALFMGLQSLAFYVVLAWLPEILQDRGIDANTAGWLLSLSQGTGVLGTLIVPVWAEKIGDQRKLVWYLVVLEMVSIAGLMLPEAFLVGLWASIIGFSLGGSFGLALLFIVMRTHDTETATELSGMAQSVGYLLAATGPTLFGALHDLTRTWFIPLLLLLIVALFKIVTGLIAAKPVNVEQTQST